MKSTKLWIVAVLSLAVAQAKLAGATKDSDEGQVLDDGVATAQQFRLQPHGEVMAAASGVPIAAGTVVQIPGERPQNQGPLIETGYTEKEPYFSTFNDGRRTRDQREMSEVLARINSANCGDYVLLVYSNTAVLYWRQGVLFQDGLTGSSPVTDGSPYQYEKHWRKTEHFYDSDVEIVRSAVKASKKAGPIEKLADKTLPIDSSDMYRVMDADAGSAASTCAMH